MAGDKRGSTAVLGLSGEEFMVCFFLLNIYSHPPLWPLEAVCSSLAHQVCCVCSWPHTGWGQLIKEASYLPFVMTFCNWPYSCLKAVARLIFPIAFVFMSRGLLFWFGFMCYISSGSFMPRVGVSRLTWPGPVVEWTNKRRCQWSVPDPAGYI